MDKVKKTYWVSSIRMATSDEQRLCRIHDCLLWIQADMNMVQDRTQLDNLLFFAREVRQYV